MKFGMCIGVVLAWMGVSEIAWADEACSSSTGDVVLQARTPEVDLFDTPSGKKIMTLEQSKFPSCAPITGRAPNFMLQVAVNGTKYWVPPYMVRYRFSGKLPAVCRNLAMGSNEQKVGSTRGLGEGCPKAGGAH
ncbi:MAG: hypothetical protein JOY77_11335 [Alphaproteobacteria bacterium]|nr:hypothetical protein [Alphaproteobacteria bacterium]MBV9063502.1 hypothetical protein [Alphaproteobacteria bacterium]